jgi:diphosphomevalonate decarboxylase
MKHIDSTATSVAHPNIAFIKYWGNCEPGLRIPANGSISMNLGGLETRTKVTFDPHLNEDELWINREGAVPVAYYRVREFMDLVRKLASVKTYAHIESENNFPMGAGIASSASAFAALALAASFAARLELDEGELSKLARKGSGSACRSIPGGFVEWLADGCDPDSKAFSIAPPDHWELWDCIAIVHRGHKVVGSTEGHSLAHTSPIQVERVKGAPKRLAGCREAILTRDFESLANVMELDCHLMHAVMMTSTPRLIYWRPETISIMKAVTSWRSQGIPACYTIDAGPNVHVICEAGSENLIESWLRQLPGVIDVITSPVGDKTRLLAE